MQIAVVEVFVWLLVLLSGFAKSQIYERIVNSFQVPEMIHSGDSI